MKRLDKAGFTIIETVLFFGITGLLVAGVLVSTGVSINIQRYRDSVVSLQSVIQQQYSETADVVNIRSSDKTCDATGITNSIVSFESRGRSDCVILGRIIRPLVTGNSLKTASVVGVLPETDIYKNDADLLSNAHLAIVPDTEDTYTLDWGTRFASVGIIMPFTVLIIRSPISGNVKTFINNSEFVSNSDLSNATEVAAKLFKADPSKTSDLKMCIEDNGLTSQPRMAVYLTSRTTSAGGVEVLGGELSGCGI